MSETSHNGHKLLPHHRAMLEASAITAETIAERGYRTALKRAELADLGYVSSQRPVPSLVVPQHGVNGAGIVGYQIRPDTPMMVDGKIWKYVSPKGSEIRLSAPPRCRPFLRRAIAPLWVVEGDKKADALASRGLCAVSVQGVDCWKVPQDWAEIELDERAVYIAFDSDVSTKRSVYGALERFRKFLAANGASVRIVYLPNGDAKLGVDDFLAAGGTVEELYALAEDELRPPPPEPQPERDAAWPTSTLLHYCEGLLGRFVHFGSADELTALALFVLHSWAFPAAAATPYLYVKSPQKRSGKTRLLELLAEVCRHPLRASSVTEAAVFQAVEKWKPTLLVDEVDAIFYGRSERAEALRLVLDAGNRPGSPVVRGTQEGEPKLFETYCPKVLAGIDRGLPDTIRDRAIVIAMERKRGGERVERFRRRDLEGDLKDLRGRLADWAAEQTEALGDYRLAEPLEVSDRLEEAWEPLIAIADLAGGDWPQRARTAAKALAKADAGNESPDDSQALLVALRAIFAERDAAHSKEICKLLNADDELPFHDYRKGDGLDGRGLGRLLKPYGIRMQKFRIGLEQARGYRREQFAEAWERYTRDDDPAVEPSQPSHRPTEPANDGAEPRHSGTVPETETVPQPSHDDAGAAGTVGETETVPQPSQPQTAAQSQTEPLWDAGTAGTDEVQGPLRVRMLADLSDGELIAAFPGSTLERPPDPPADDYAKRHRKRMAAGAWGLDRRGEA